MQFLDFNNELIQCQTYNDFYVLGKNFLDTNIPKCEGICIFDNSRLILNKEYTKELTDCNPVLIKKYKKLITGFGSSVTRSVSIANACDTCNKIFLLHAFCQGETRGMFGTWYVDSITHKVYQ